MKKVNKERLSYGLGIVILILVFVFDNFIVRAILLRIYIILCLILIKANIF